jgi:hypothetical protein
MHKVLRLNAIAGVDNMASWKFIVYRHFGAASMLMLFDSSILSHLAH